MNGMSGVLCSIGVEAQASFSDDPTETQVLLVDFNRSVVLGTGKKRPRPDEDVVERTVGCPLIIKTHPY